MRARRLLRPLLAALFATGAIAGFASGFHELRLHHRGWGAGPGHHGGAPACAEAPPPPVR